MNIKGAAAAGGASEPCSDSPAGLHPESSHRFYPWIPDGNRVCSNAAHSSIGAGRSSWNGSSRLKIRSEGFLNADAVQGAPDSCLRKDSMERSRKCGEKKNPKIVLRGGRLLD